MNFNEITQQAMKKALSLTKKMDQTGSGSGMAMGSSNIALGSRSSLDTVHLQGQAMHTRTITFHPQDSIVRGDSEELEGDSQLTTGNSRKSRVKKGMHTRTISFHPQDSILRGDSEELEGDSQRTTGNSRKSRAKKSKNYRMERRYQENRATFREYTPWGVNAFWLEFKELKQEPGHQDNQETLLGNRDSPDALPLEVGSGTSCPRMTMTAEVVQQDLDTAVEAFLRVGREDTKV